ncbi:TIGR03619 family F420-dependent LLM class oxidoreductase [Saccharopolyspora erythraea]|uniref:TIGR03619 family F420-dependent LLM class oxidoreductase n=1 Tax=Saccharopolyspora erythraea TaxID=1836 RepID=UPI00201222EC|nr:TIGR03619 family F420-dependent LLM class oxidoreductase [Saccharopolyspora erythraea]
MATMRLGLALPQFGPFADPSAVASVAADAESLGFDSLWAAERVHAPLEPEDPYPGGNGAFPELFRAGLDPLLTLTVAATATSRVRLGTSTLNAPLHSPIHLARSLAGIDRLSGGRLVAGFGLSWSRDEYRAVSVPWEQRGARLDETIDVLEALWSPDPVEHRGRFWTISRGTFGPKPVQDRPPLYLGGASPAALRRAGRRADGWLGLPLPPEALQQVLATLRGHAREAGREPVRTALRINPQIQDGPSGDPATSTVEDVCRYLRQVAEIGVEEAFIDLQGSARSAEELLELAGRFRKTFAS